MDWLPPWSLIEGVLRSLVLPAFSASVVCFAIVCALTKRMEVRVCAGVLALIAGLAAGNYFRELLQWWPVDEPAGEESQAATSRALARGWPALLPITVAALGICLVASLIPRRAGRWPGVLLRTATAAGVAWWIAEPLGTLSKSMTFAVLFAGMVASHEALLFASERTLKRISLPLLTVPWGAVAAGVLIFAHSARFSDVAALMTVSICGVGLVAALWAVEPTSLFAGPAMLIPPLTLATAANTFSEVPVSAFACVAFAPAALWLTGLPQLARLSPRARMAAAAILVIIPCVVAISMAAWMEDLSYGE